MKRVTLFPAAAWLALGQSLSVAQSPPAPAVPAILKESRVNYTAAAGEVMTQLQAKFYLPDQGLYAASLKKREPDFMWGNGVMFTALAAAARHDRQYLPLMNRFFTAMDRYWDFKAPRHGYEPAPTTGNGNDKYYDDNAWMVITFLEAFAVTGDAAYRTRAEETLAFVLSGQDEKLGGGIYWHEPKKTSKNTCVNAPAAVGCLLLAHHLPADRAQRSVDTARRLVEWTTRHLQSDDGRYFDAIEVDNGKVNEMKWTYNSALMIRAYLGLHRFTGDAAYLQQAKRIGKACDAFVDYDRKAYREKDFKFNHLLHEADLELYRATQDEHYLRRAILGADAAYAFWRATPPDELIESASIARMLWLMADTQSESGQAFWHRTETVKRN